MVNFTKRFIQAEDGAVTVDWVVLCAGIVGLAVLIVAAMQSGALGLSDGIKDYMSSWTF